VVEGKRHRSELGTPSAASLVLGLDRNHDYVSLGKVVSVVVVTYFVSSFVTFICSILLLMPSPICDNPCRFLWNNSSNISRLNAEMVEDALSEVDAFVIDGKEWFCGVA
jgi:hypothetical protein